MIIQTERKTGKCSTAAHATSVEDATHGEHHPDRGLEDGTTEPNFQDLNQQEESSHDADGKISFDEVPNHEGSTTQCEQRTKQMSCWQQVESRRGSSEQDMLETSKNDCQTSRSTLDKAHLQLESSDLHQAPEARKTRQEMRRRRQRMLTTNQNQQRQQRFHERRDVAHHGTRWSDMGLHVKLLCEQQTQATNTTRDLHHHDHDNPIVHDRSPRSSRRRRQRRPRRKRRR